jgi:hypothetical protein
MMRNLVRLSISALLLSLAVAGCSGNKDNEPPVATPSLSLSKDRVPIGSAVTLRYKFDVAPNATFDKDYLVFVHVLDTDGEAMWTDDHMPPIVTSKWKGGETVEYTRTIFVPNYPYIGEVQVRLGLYDPPTGRRLPLNAQQVSRREYLVTKFQILGSNENIFLIDKEGWHLNEVDAQNPQNEWKWTKKAATLSFRNPKKDSTIYFQYDARVDLFNPPQQLTIKVNGQPVTTMPADSKFPTLKSVPVTAAQLGTGDMVDLVFELDRTFQPGGNDPRELGIRVFHTYIEPK